MPHMTKESQCKKLLRLQVRSDIMLDKCDFEARGLEFLNLKINAMDTSGIPCREDKELRSSQIIMIQFVAS